MIMLTALYGAFLTALGLFAYFGINSESITALIPTFFGIPILIIAALQARGQILQIGLVISIILAAIGFFATIPGVLKVPAILGNAAVDRPEAAMVQATMSLLSLLYLVPAIGHIMSRNKAHKNT